jgi:hypothetical protein
VYNALVNVLPSFRSMRWTLAAAVCAAVALAGASLSTAAVRPVLRLDAGNALRGSHFKAHELVRVVFTSDVQRVRVLRASATGAFAAPLPAPTDSCSGVRIRATGATGDVAAIAISAGLCPPASDGTGGAGSVPLPDPHGPPTVDPGPR